jgi:hypothetical protein
LTDARQGAGFLLADAWCRLLAARALAANLCPLRAAGDAEREFFTGLSAVESAAAASCAAAACTTIVFGYAGPKGPAKDDLRRFYSLRAAVDTSLAVLHSASIRTATFLLARSIDNHNTL